MMAAVMYIDSGRAISWLVSCELTSSSLATRDTTIPAAIEMISEGICATRPSPMASRV